MSNLGQPNFEVPRNSLAKIDMRSASVTLIVTDLAPSVHIDVAAASFEESRTRHRHSILGDPFRKKGEYLLAWIGLEVVEPLDIYA